MKKYLWTDDLKLFTTRTKFHQQLSEYMLTTRCVSHGSSILDIGCGAGETVTYLAQISSFPFQVTLVEPGDEIKKAELSLLKNRVTPTCFNEKIETFISVQHNRSFDLILVSHSVYYFKSRGEVIKRLTKLLSPGGKVLLVVRGNRGFDIRLRLFLDTIFPEASRTFEVSRIDEILQEQQINYSTTTMQTEINTTTDERTAFFKKKLVSENILSALIRFVGHRQEYSLRDEDFYNIAAFIRSYLDENDNKLLFEDFIYHIQN